MSERPECVYLSRAISVIPVFCHIKVFQSSSSSPRSVFLALPCSVMTDHDSWSNVVKTNLTELPIKPRNSAAGGSLFFMLLGVFWRWLGMDIG